MEARFKLIKEVSSKVARTDLDAKSGENILGQVMFSSFSSRTSQASHSGGKT